MSLGYIVFDKQRFICVTEGKKYPLIGDRETCTIIDDDGNRRSSIAFGIEQIVAASGFLYTYYPPDENLIAGPEATLDEVMDIVANTAVEEVCADPAFIERIGDVAKRFAESIKIPAIEIEQKTHCHCGVFLGPTRINMGLKDCTKCSAARVLEEAKQQRREKLAGELSAANQKVFAGLTAHLIVR